MEQMRVQFNGFIDVQGTMFAKLGHLFKYIMTEGDRRTFSVFLSDPWIPLYTLIGYVFLVKIIGPWYMRDKKPYDLKNTLLVYNAFQVALSAYIVVMLIQHGWMSLPNWFKCKPIETKTTPEFLHIMHIHHLYYLSKYTELLDTVFFVLRKKQSQITFLHVYHHGTMPLFTVLTLRFSPGSSISAVGFLNCLVHVVMYGYYLLAALGPQMQKYLWWKKYITTMQIIQFSIFIMHFSIVLFSSCNVPKGLVLFMICNTSVNLFLFLNFYRRQYKKKAKAKALANEKTILENDIKGNISNELKGTTNLLYGIIGTTNLNGFTLFKNLKQRTPVLK